MRSGALPRLRRLQALTAGVVVLLGVSVPAAAADSGSFTSSDPLLNQIWAASVTTATDMLAPGPLTVDASGDPCAIDLPVVIVDGKVRDRCPYIGDEAVTGMTLLVSTPSAESAMRDEIVWFANAQSADGTIPASPLFGSSLVLFDYEAYWVQCVYDYVLYTGDMSLANQVWPNLVKLMNTWYPSKAQANGLVVNPYGPADYAFIRRQGSLVAYFNAGYVLALREASQLATWTGDTPDAQAWTARATALVAPFNATFWDGSSGAYIDTPSGPVVHPQDGNVFAILAGLASAQQTTSALDYLSSANSRPWGNTMVDSNSAWGQDPDWGTDPMDRAYPFIGYFEVLARFQSSLDDSAIDLIRREWGWMLDNPPETGTMWEDIGPGGGAPRDPNPSYDHGWSSGAAPALTSYVLGVRPTSPGFATFVVDPHPGSTITSASGVVPTPQGDLSVSWQLVSGKPLVTVKAPPGEIWTNAPATPPTTATTATTTPSTKAQPKPKPKPKAKTKTKTKTAKKQKPKARTKAK